MSSGVELVDWTRGLLDDSHGMLVEAMDGFDDPEIRDVLLESIKSIEDVQEKLSSVVVQFDGEIDQKLAAFRASKFVGESDDAL
ncbi:MAG: hypothetical protein EBU08_11325 [Micrococcales bacterium]|nr:hypothetical protein [Micrococcales bacterium]